MTDMTNVIFYLVIFFAIMTLLEVSIYKEKKSYRWELFWWTISCIGWVLLASGYKDKLEKAQKQIDCLSSQTNVVEMGGDR